MFFSRSTVFVALSALVVSAAAAPSALPASQCNTGSISCCNSTQKANSADASQLLGQLGVVVSDVTALVGLGCSPLSLVGAGGNSCNAAPVCCEDNHFNGLITAGCVPVNLSA
ncbi:fungal hydrophobin [Punctularia strigosozonata HHB-11173 SS5]|uniref:fungal hydrophobin n=1 Tax=Punctularia strigosozonata (strain HHB-11173) TaxID=741275 RepID=UPI00044166BC|nr:fungal hydrophobin [Punctularia strigosozonata HHB-11173 SS5]EIN08598.1 fungal hydrophobin [Punctularia strigosozonata HHB-11173 SS5]